MDRIHEIEWTKIYLWRHTFVACVVEQLKFNFFFHFSGSQSVHDSIPTAEYASWSSQMLRMTGIVNGRAD